jgi:hypothetical protein
MAWWFVVGLGTRVGPGPAQLGSLDIERKAVRWPIANPGCEQLGPPSIVACKLNPGREKSKELFEGLEFESEEAAKLFYVNYARLNCFLLQWKLTRQRNAMC